jgi:hypothetical protein
MIKFNEWIGQQATVNIKPVLTGESSWQEINSEMRRVVDDATSYLQNNPEEDRVEFTIYGHDIRIWKTKINTIEKIHLGSKSSWENKYSEISIDDLIEWLYQTKGRTTNLKSVV